MKLVRLLYAQEYGFPPFVLKINKRYYFIDGEKNSLPCGLFICEVLNPESLKQLIGIEKAKKLYKNDPLHPILSNVLVEYMQKYLKKIAEIVCDPFATTEHGVWYLELSEDGVQKKEALNELGEEYGNLLEIWIRKDDYRSCVISEGYSGTYFSPLPIIRMKI
jgi:hypothetical protein